MSKESVQPSRVRQDEACVSTPHGHLSELLVDKASDAFQRCLDEERAAIARELHDELGGALAAMRFDLAWIDRHTQDEGIRSRVRAAIEMLQHAVGASQRIACDLRPPALDQGLVAALQQLAANFEKRTGIQTSLAAMHTETELPEAVQHVVYRTLQEALTNAGKHAACRAVAIELAAGPEGLTLRITDDGRSLAPDSPVKPDAFGLKGLRERAAALKGRLEITGRAGAGTTLVLSIPTAPGPSNT